MAAVAWWIVILPGEYITTSETFGPFRSEKAAQEVADRWNGNNPDFDERAAVLPILPPAEIAQS